MTGDLDQATAPSVRRTTISMGTFLVIECQPPIGSSGAVLLDAVCSVFERVESRMHPDREGSDLSAIARAPRKQPVPVDPWTLEVLRASRELCVASDGLFDPCLPEAQGRITDLEFVPPDSVVCSGAPVALDLGGIAKGFAIDQAITTLQQHGCLSGLINAGGDVRVFGSVPTAISIRVAGMVRGTVSLRDEALAVSESRPANAPSGHQGIYSPLTARRLPALAAAVRAPTAMIADALTKCVMLCPPSVSARLLRDHAAGRVEIQG